MTFPVGNEASRMERQITDIGNLPAIVGAIDCTQIPTPSRGGEQTEISKSKSILLTKCASYL